MNTFDRLWAALANIGRNAATGGYDRFAWTRTDHDLREWFAGECAALGLDLVEDRAGNQWGWWGDPDAAGPGSALVLGSHLDSVPDGGAFDGPLGVASALAVVADLRARGVTPERPLAVVNFVDEEGARFGVACAGSRIITGVLPAQRALGLRDADGVTMAEAWRASGRNPDDMGADPETLRRVGAFVELHVEQGRALALDPGDPDGPGDPTLSGREVAIGTDIWPHGRWRVDLPGQANHAGTTRLVDRTDPMLALAEVVLAARSGALTHGCVATVGKATIHPGGVNAIPGHVSAWLDSRGADPAAVREVVGGIEAIAGHHGGSVTQESWTPVTRFDPALVARLQQVLPEAPLLGTAAGHDAGILANAGIPSAMLFVRNPSGISHAPGEHAETGDCHAGAAALTMVVEALTEGRSPA